MSRNFENIIVADFEYEVSDGDLPNVLCMVAYVLDENLRHVRTIKRWRGGFDTVPPFDIGKDTLFVAYSAWAEMTCFKVLGWRFPVHIFDQHTAYLAASNILFPYDPDAKRKRQSKKLPDACRAYGIEGWEHLDKGTIAKDIGEGRWRDYGQTVVFDYCEEDVRKSVELLCAQMRGTYALPPADVSRVLHWSNYSAKAIALIQARGMPIDMPMWNTVQENKAAVIGHLLQKFDPSYGDKEPIYSPEGEWNYDRFAQWLARSGIRAWPRLDSGQLDIDSDAFRLMYQMHPGIERLHALRDSVGFIAKARLPIGRDGRNRPSLFPFCTATGRNAHAKSPYNAHAGVRSFMACPPGSTMAYLDWRSQEVGVAAVLSGDDRLKFDYATGDVYHALARMCGLTNELDPRIWKKTERAQRDRMKPLQLGINYGMGVPSLARGLDRHPLIASTIIELHKRTYPRFWEWRAKMVHEAMLKRRIESQFGWSLRISTSPNKRTLYNFPMQAGGAEMLREAAVKLCEAEIVPIMLIHDGILFEETNPEKIEHAKEIMLQAGRNTCEGFEIGVDVDQLLRGGERYRDKREVAQDMWKTIMEALTAVGAWRKRA
jgi:DNA polymerase I